MTINIEDVKYYLLGTSNSISDAIENFNLDEEFDESELEDMISFTNIERCPYCEWWFESSELLDDDDEVVGCRDCR